MLLSVNCVNGSYRFISNFKQPSHGRRVTRSSQSMRRAYVEAGTLCATMMLLIFLSLIGN